MTAIVDALHFADYQGPLGQLIHVANTFKLLPFAIMGFPHRGLLGGSASQRVIGAMPITSIASPVYLPGLRHTEEAARRTLYPCLPEVSNASVIDAAAPVFRIHVKTPSTGSDVSLPVSSCTACQIT